MCLSSPPHRRPPLRLRLPPRLRTQFPTPPPPSDRQHWEDTVISEKPFDTDDIWVILPPDPKPAARKAALPGLLPIGFRFGAAATSRRAADPDKVVDDLRCSGQI
jgi:hypothetical protein